MKRIIILANSCWHICNFRLPLMHALRLGGYEVLVIVPFDGYEKQLMKTGFHCLDFPFKSNNINPFHDLRLLLRYNTRFRNLKPDCILSFTIKPTVYGSIAARWNQIPIINNITGLGSTIIGGGFFARFIIMMYRYALRHSTTVFFQNDDDMGLFLSRRIVRKSQCARLPGSGVDLRRFAPQKGTPHALFRFLFVGRLLRDKGIHEYINAACIVKKQIPEAEFFLLGQADVDNPTTITSQELKKWTDRGIVRYFGQTDDPRPFLAEADCVVLPSYREGLSRTLLEAAAMAKPIIATNVPGCRDVVEYGKNGFLCEVKNAVSLANQMIKMVKLDQEARSAMGRYGRNKIEREFDVTIVTQKYLTAIGHIVSGNLQTGEST